MSEQTIHTSRPLARILEAKLHLTHLAAAEQAHKAGLDIDAAVSLSTLLLAMGRHMGALEHGCHDCGDLHAAVICVKVGLPTTGPLYVIQGGASTGNTP